MTIKEQYDAMIADVERVRISNCKHRKAYMFHDNAPYYCPDCDRYIEFDELPLT